MNLEGGNRRPQRVRVNVLISAFLALLALALWWYPKWDLPYPDQPEMGRRWYRGFGLVDDRSIAGKLYYRIDEVLTLPEDGVCHIEFRYGREKHPFIARYPNGNIRAKGLCKVALIDGQPYAMDMTRISDAEYYSPDGKTKTVVQDGTGVETFWSADGVKVWEVHLENGKRTELKTWYRNGNRQIWAPHFKDGRVHGGEYHYNEDGTLRVIIYYENGFEKRRETPSKTASN